MRRTLSIAGVAILLTTPVSAQPAPPPASQSRGALHAPGSDVAISLITIGPGSQIWQMFGHSAIWIHDNHSGRDTVFNWGAFDLSSRDFIPRFLVGLLFYQIAGDAFQDVLGDARFWNRTVTVQELDLSTAQKESILSAIRLNVRPENVVYRYDYFVNNCATKPRDILDRALGGALRAGADSLSGSTYRSDALRLMQENWLLALGANIGLGEPSDRPITVWEGMFLPQKLHDWVATRQVRDSAGIVHPLVKSERLLVRATRPPEPTRPPSFAWLWIVGAIVAALFAWLGAAARTARPARMSAALVFSVWATVAGLVGMILALLWTATDHRFAHANENLLLFNPLWLVLAVTLPMTIIRGRAPWITDRLLVTVLALDGVALIAHVVGVSRQANLPTIGLSLLPALGLLLATRRRHAA